MPLRYLHNVLHTVLKNNCRPISILIEQINRYLFYVKMRNKCIVWKCNNKGVHRLPKDPALKSKWIEALKLDKHIKVHRKLTANSVVCSGHFKSTDFISTSSCEGIKYRRILKRNVVPSIFACSSQEPVQCDEPNDTEDIAKCNASSCLKTYSREVLPSSFVEVCPFLDTSVCGNGTENDPLQLDAASLTSSNVDDQELTAVHGLIQVQREEYDITDDTLEVNSSDQIHHPTSCTTKSDVYVQTDKMYNGFSIQTIKHVDKTVHFYTGLESFPKFMLVFNTLGPTVNNLIYFYDTPPRHIEPLDQFFIALMILYRHKTFEEISNLFLIPIKQVLNIFVTWIRFMALQWQNLDIWLDRENIKAYMPLDFYDKFPCTRVIFDATECPIKKPKLPLAQQITFSNYKNRNTVKFMIGITPSGLISYVSPCYGGSITDRQIIERSSVINKFDYGDEIMVDKGINIQDILVPYGVKVNMPAFFKKGSQIQPSTLTTNRKVASKRVHVERVIGLMKTYKILTQPMNHTETVLSSNIAFICAMLVNFRSYIINKSTC